MRLRQFNPVNCDNSKPDEVSGFAGREINLATKLVMENPK